MSSTTNHSNNNSTSSTKRALPEDSPTSNSSNAAKLQKEAPQAQQQLLKLSKSIFLVEPLETNLKLISDFIYKHLNKPNLEIEAKFGIIIDKETRQRIRFPTMSEVVLTEDFSSRIRFESNMTDFQHRHFNQMLNYQVEQSRSENYKGSPITYEHLRHIDTFYQSGNGGERIRVTTDQKTQQIIPNGMIKKSRIANLNIHSPMTKLDFRISLNIETPVKEKPLGKGMQVRNKDRLSYTNELIKIDLTQVKSEFDNNKDSGNTTHELELEFLSSDQLKRERKLIEEGKSNQYINIVQSFLNNIRLLAQKSI